MADSVKVALVILWEDELRKAAALLKVARDMEEGTPGFENAVSAAWAACNVALYGITDDTNLVMLANSHLKRGGKKKEKGDA